MARWIRRTSPDREDGRLGLLPEMEELDGVGDEATQHAFAEVDDLAGHDALHPVLPGGGEAALDFNEEAGAVVGSGHVQAAAAFDLHGLAEELPGELFGFRPGLAGEDSGGARSGEFGVDIGDELTAAAELGEGVAGCGLAGDQPFEGGGELVVDEGLFGEVAGVEGDLRPAGVDAPGGELLGQVGGVGADVGFEEQFDAPVGGGG